MMTGVPLCRRRVLGCSLSGFPSGRISGMQKRKARSETSESAAAPQAPRLSFLHLHRVHGFFRNHRILPLWISIQAHTTRAAQACTRHAPYSKNRSPEKAEKREFLFLIIQHLQHDLPGRPLPVFRSIVSVGKNGLLFLRPFSRIPADTCAARLTPDQVLQILPNRVRRRCLNAPYWGQDVST